MTLQTFCCNLFENENSIWTIHAIYKVFVVLKVIPCPLSLCVNMVKPYLRLRKKIQYEHSVMQLQITANDFPFTNKNRAQTLFLYTKFLFDTRNSLIQVLPAI